MKKIFCVFMAAMLCAAFVSVTALAADSNSKYVPSFEVDSQAVYLVNLDNELTIYEKNADEKIEPSSLAQLMTVVLALENVEDPIGETVTMKGYVQDTMYKYNVKLGGIRLAGLYKNETISVKNLMLAVMIRGANEAAMMLGDYVGDGSEPYFVELMNQRAYELGMYDTHFTSAHGLPDPESYTTAKDMAKLARHAVTLEGFDELVETVNHNGGPTNINQTLHWNNTNRLKISSSPYYNPSAMGIKDGYHNDLGSYSLSIAQRDGYSYLLVCMASGGVDENGADASLYSVFRDTNRLYDWAFTTFRVKTLLEKGKSFGEVPLKMAWGKDFLRVMSASDFTALIPDAIQSSSIQFELDLPQYVVAPVDKGDLVGQVRLILAGEEIGIVGVVAAEYGDVSRALLLLEALLDITRTFWFKFIVILMVVLIILYIALAIIRNRNRRRYRGIGQ